MNQSLNTRFIPIIYTKHLKSKEFINHTEQYGYPGKSAIGTSESFIYDMKLKDMEKWQRSCRCKNIVERLFITLLFVYPSYLSPC